MENGTVSGRDALIGRVKAIILSPKEEWPKIAAEPTSQAQILTGYVLILAAITPIATFLGSQIFGLGLFGISFRPSLMSSLFSAIVSYVMTIVGVFVLSYIANFLAPKFEGESNSLNAFKLVAYGGTAAWLAGVFNLIPALAFFTLLGLYSLYLFYTGVVPLMKVPAAKALPYTAVTFLCAIVIFVIIGFVAGRVVGPVGPHISGSSGKSGGIFGSGSDSGTISIPGVGSIDTGKMQEAAKRAEKVQKGEIKSVPTDTLKAMLPASIGQFTRTGISTQAMGRVEAGVEGKYKVGDYQFDLRVNDMLALAGFAGMASAMGIERTKEDENGYERVGQVDGQWRSEKWNTQSERGSYSVMIADRFQVEARGKVPSIDVLKSAVASIDAGDLEDLSE